MLIASKKGRDNNHPIVWELSCIIGGNQLPPFIASLTPAEAGRAITHQTPDSRLWSRCDLFSSGFTLRDPTTSYAGFSHGELTDYPHHMHSLSPPPRGPGTPSRAGEMPLLFHLSFFTCILKNKKIDLVHDYKIMFNRLLRPAWSGFGSCWFEFISYKISERMYCFRFRHYFYIKKCHHW